MGPTRKAAVLPNISKIRPQNSSVQRRNDKRVYCTKLMDCNPTITQKTDSYSSSFPMVYGLQKKYFHKQRMLKIHISNYLVMLQHNY